MTSLKEIILAYPNLKLGRPATSSELTELEDVLQVPLPSEVEELIRCARTYSSSSMDSIDFTGRIYREFCAAPGVFTRYVPLYKTLEGNFWAVDVLSDGQWGSVFYISHDPAVVIVQFRSILEFILSTVHDNNIEDNQLIISARRNKGVIASKALTSNDLTIAKFAATIASNYSVFDLRSGSHEVGFERDYGSTCVRAGDDLIFGLSPAMKPKGWFDALLSR